MQFSIFKIALISLFSATIIGCAPGTANSTAKATAVNSVAAGLAPASSPAANPSAPGPANANFDVSACLRQGYSSAQVMQLPYSTTGNIRLFSTDSGTFGANDVRVIQFTTSALAQDFSSIQFAPIAGTLYNNRIITLSKSPNCVIASSNSAGGEVMATSIGLFPIFFFQIGGTSCTGTRGCNITSLQPSTTYFVTVVNRDSYGAAPSLSQNSCMGNQSCDFTMDFNN